MMPPDEQRRVSKMVNYALLYGKTAFTLAKDLDVPRKQAEEFIAAYFARYSQVRRFIDETIEKARETGTGADPARTLAPAARPALSQLPDPRGSGAAGHEHARAGLGRRPHQEGHARPRPRAARRKLASRLILQIHDELLLEVPEHEAETAKALVREVMEGALTLDVPLVAEARLGATWADVH
jgi:DNA polymerase-1